jgi:hypothetical protein
VTTKAKEAPVSKNNVPPNLRSWQDDPKGRYWRLDHINPPTGRAVVMVSLSLHFGMAVAPTSPIGLWLGVGLLMRCLSRGRFGPSSTCANALFFPVIALYGGDHMLANALTVHPQLVIALGVMAGWAATQKVASKYYTRTNWEIQIPKIWVRKNKEK